jgi:ABC-type lipoprotein export system ATPase subunit
LPPKIFRLFNFYYRPFLKPYTFYYSNEMILVVENLQKSYVSPNGETQTVVSVANFSLNRGEQIALQGESGSGKTTLLNLIAGILQADAGKITIDETEMTALTEAERDSLRAKKIGYVFQTFNLLQGFSALENVMLGMAFGVGAEEKFALNLLKRVALADRKDFTPRQLSVGQQQRVAVARALANRPKIVLADEPTGNLDRKRAFESLELIREICAENETALLLVSHDQEILSKFEKVKNLAEINKCS